MLSETVIDRLINRFVNTLLVVCPMAIFILFIMLIMENIN